MISIPLTFHLEKLFCFSVLTESQTSFQIQILLLARTYYQLANAYCTASLNRQTFQRQFKVKTVAFPYWNPHGKNLFIICHRKSCSNSGSEDVHSFVLHLQNFEISVVQKLHRVVVFGLLCGDHICVQKAISSWNPVGTTTKKGEQTNRLKIE